jgi:hypothetical protein
MSEAVGFAAVFCDVVREEALGLATTLFAGVLDADFFTVAVVLAFLATGFFAEVFFTTAFFVVDFLTGAFRADARRALAFLVRLGAVFQPLALSARNVAGIATASVGSSVTAAEAASARSARTSEITFAGRRAFAECTRLVSSTTNMSRLGSIQSDVPV